MKRGKDLVSFNHIYTIIFYIFVLQMSLFSSVKNTLEHSLTDKM